MVRSLVKLALGPALYYTYTNNGQRYLPTLAENWADNIQRIGRIAAFIGRKAFPFWLVKTLWSSEVPIREAILLLPLWNWILYFGSITAGHGVAVVLRIYGRARNPMYQQFYSVFADPSKHAQLGEYDYEYSHMPFTFKVKVPDMKRNRVVSIAPEVNNVIVHHIRKLIADIFARRIIYPGSTMVLHTLLRENALQGRHRLYSAFHGQRVKIGTESGEAVDGVFVDRRPATARLVISFEGNASFYEAGVSMTALEQEHSVLATNAPGFMESTGLPTPASVQEAAEAVMDFAIQHLHYEPHQILLYGWSIGGYPVAHLARSYPDLMGVIVDASFDSIVPLAVNHMPKQISRLTEDTIREFFYLNIGELLVQSRLPILLYRRLKDEVMSRGFDIATSRTTHLARMILKARFTGLLNENMMDAYLNDEIIARTLHSDLQRNFPDLESMAPLDAVVGAFLEGTVDLNLDDEMRNNVTVYVIMRHLIDVSTTHCPPLPKALWRDPWVYPNSISK